MLHGVGGDSLRFLCVWAAHSRLPAMIEAAKLIARHLPNVLTYFEHHITSAVAEGLNSKIATIQKRACGFRNRAHFQRLAAHYQSEHDAQHRMMECLAEMIWQAQRNGTTPDASLYLTCLEKK